MHLTLLGFSDSEMKQNYMHVLKEFNISPKQESSYHRIVRNLLGVLKFILGTGNVFILNNMKG